MRILISEIQLRNILSESTNNLELSEERIDLDKIKEKNIGNGFTEEEFNNIARVSDNNPTFILWLLNRVKENKIKKEDVYKYEKYFQIFNKYKRQFDIKDINQYKTSVQIDMFKNKCIDILDQLKSIQQPSGEQGSTGKYIDPNGLSRLKSVGIKYLGMSEGYQIFEIPNELKDDENAWKVYRNVLGKCGDETDSSIHICTIAGYNEFRRYLSDYEDSSYFVIYNESDSLSPYQIHYESRQFMDRKDNPI